MSVLTDLIYGGSNAVAGLTESAVNDAIAKYGADKELAFPDTAYFFPTIYAATGVKVKTLGDLPACVQHRAGRRGRRVGIFLSRRGFSRFRAGAFQRLTARS